MKKLFFILFATFSSVANAKNAVPKSASEVAPLSIGKKNSNFILKSFGNNEIILFCPKREFEIDFEVLQNYKSVVNLHSCSSLISILKNLN